MDIFMTIFPARVYWQYVLNLYSLHIYYTRHYKENIVIIISRLVYDAARNLPSSAGTEATDTANQMPRLLNMQYTPI